MRGQGGYLRSIPARAGEPCWNARTRRLPTVYPRACGGTPYMMSPRMRQPGLSPRVRGNRYAELVQRLARGSIPARAGEPLPAGLPLWSAVVYPRACGGTACGLGQAFDGGGLSPRVRGNPSNFVAGVTEHGSIPARAGEPHRLHVCRQASTVYPRACGGTTLSSIRKPA